VSKVQFNLPPPSVSRDHAIHVLIIAIDSSKISGRSIVDRPLLDQFS